MGYSEADWTWLFSKALAKEPRERFSAAAELVDELGSLHPSGSAILGRSHGAGARDSPSIHALPTIALPGRSRPRGLGRRPALSVLSAAGASGLLFVSLGISTSPAGPRGALQRTATEARRAPIAARGLGKRRLSRRRHLLLASGRELSMSVTRRRASTTCPRIRIRSRADPAPPPPPRPSIPPRGVSLAWPPGSR